MVSARALSMYDSGLVALRRAFSAFVAQARALPRQLRSQAPAPIARTRHPQHGPSPLAVSHDLTRPSRSRGHLTTQRAHPRGRARARRCPPSSSPTASTTAPGLAAPIRRSELLAPGLRHVEEDGCPSDTCFCGGALHDVTLLTPLRHAISCVRRCSSGMLRGARWGGRVADLLLRPMNRTHPHLPQRTARRARRSGRPQAP